MCIRDSIEAYEAKHFPMDLPDPVEAIKFEMERKSLTVKDLEPMIGKSNRVYEILNHKRSLTLKMIWKLHEGLGIPCLLYTSDAADERSSVDLGGRRIIKKKTKQLHVDGINKK